MTCDKSRSKIQEMRLFTKDNHFRLKSGGRTESGDYGDVLRIKLTICHPTIILRQNSYNFERNAEWASNSKMFVSTATTRRGFSLQYIYKQTYKRNWKNNRVLSFSAFTNRVRYSQNDGEGACSKINNRNTYLLSNEILSRKIFP